MKACCLNCKYFDPVQPPYCNWHMGYTDPDSICECWVTNQKETTP
jgi:hypothetical protein